MEIEKINIEEVYGEPIDENDTIFKLSNSGIRANMYFVNDMLLNYYCRCASIDNEYVDYYELTTRIANDSHEGKLNEECIRNKMLEMFEKDKLSIKNKFNELTKGGNLYDN